MDRVGEILEEPTGHRSAEELRALEEEAEAYNGRQRRAFLSILERIGRLETNLSEIGRRLESLERELVRVRRGQRRGRQ